MRFFPWMGITGPSENEIKNPISYFCPMTLKIASLNSGSNGNCYYVGNATEAVLIDAGISCRETERRMNRLGLSMGALKAIFVSHEHSDHISGIARLSRKYRLPVYITSATHKASRVFIEKHLLESFNAHEPVTIGSLEVKAFPKFHDACDPYSFFISSGSINVGVFTDIGHSCKQVIKYFKKCNAAFLEANYCHDMLANGSYPFHLKKRISSDNGHLSNVQARDLFIKYRSPQLTHLILSHLSENNNSPELVEQIFKTCAGKTKIVVASRYAESEVYSLTDNGTIPVRTEIKTQQLSLF